MTITTPTAQEFLAQLDTDDEDLEPELESLWDTPSPLDSIAESLRRIAAGLGGDSFTAELVQETPDTRLQETFDDLEDKHRSLFELLAEVEKIVKPSSSKVSLDVKAAIDAWKNPDVSQALTADEVAAGPVPASNAAEMKHPHPAHDADVNEWREYARWLGHQGPDIDKANRSQIRTMLGIEQPA